MVARRFVFFWLLAGGCVNLDPPVPVTLPERRDGPVDGRDAQTPHPADAAVPADADQSDATATVGDADGDLTDGPAPDASPADLAAVDQPPPLADAAIDLADASPPDAPTPDATADATADGIWPLPDAAVPTDAPSMCTTSATCAPEQSCVNGTCVRTPGLVLFWRFEETSGTTVADSSGNGHGGSYLGAPLPSTMLPPLSYPNARSLGFVQTARQAVTLAGMPAALKPVNDFSVAFWYRSTRVDTMGAEVLSSGDNWLIRLRAPGIEFGKNTTGGFSRCNAPAATFLDGMWHHVAAVINSVDGMRVYYDGNQTCASVDARNVTYNVGNDFFVGRHGDGETQWDFDGNVDEVRLYNRILSLPEITALAQGSH